MPQGKVVAVKPYSLVGNPDEEQVSTSQSPNSETANEERLITNLVYISDNEDNPNKEEKIFWYEDKSLNLAVGTPVEFKINNRRTRKIKEAVEVKKDKSLNPSLPKGLLSKVALLTSLLLIASVIIEGKKNR